MNGIRWYVIGMLSLLPAVASRLQAQEPTPGDVATPECVYLQNTVHDELRITGDQWRNHGELMKRVQEIVSRELEAGNITEECSSCITNQYARDIDPDLQEPCGPPENPDERFARIADRVPGFGGMFRDDEQDTMVIYLVDPAQHDAAVQALQASFGPERVPADRVQVLQGDYDFRQLKTWKDRLTPLLSNSAVLSTDVDEASNRLVVGVDESSGQLIDTSQLDIPPEAIVLEESEPQLDQGLNGGMYPSLVAGLQISWPSSSTTIQRCTLGFNANLYHRTLRLTFSGLWAHYSWGESVTTGFVTGSHCTQIRGEQEGTVFYQPYPQTFPAGPGNRIGVEYRDPPWLAGDPCPTGKLCRYSDSAFVRSPHPDGPSVTRRQGFIARPNLNSTVWNGMPTYRIVKLGAPIQGETVYKVGLRTGKTRGTVRRTCQDTGVSGTNFLLFCQGRASYATGEGDSGGPVFGVRSGTNDVVLYGINRGGNSTGGTFSLIRYVQWELVRWDNIFPSYSSTHVAGICAPGFGC